MTYEEKIQKLECLHCGFEHPLITNIVRKQKKCSHCGHEHTKDSQLDKIEITVNCGECKNNSTYILKSNRDDD